MITRKHLRLDHAIRFSWKNILFSTCCWALAFASMRTTDLPRIEIPISIIAVLGTALAIILAFRNSSAYERWWEARIIWGGLLNESRTFARQIITFSDQTGSATESRVLIYMVIGWVNALRLQMRLISDQKMWDRSVRSHLPEDTREKLRSFNNAATAIGMEIARRVKEIHTAELIGTLLFVQLDNTLTRITDLQGRTERIRNTPLPRPYDYYTLAFLNIFILFFPFGMIHQLQGDLMQMLLLPITVIVGWIFYQIYVFGKVLSHPFQNWRTDVPLDSITNTIEIDLKQILGDRNVPPKLEPVNGVLM